MPIYITCDYCGKRIDHSTYTKAPISRFNLIELRDEAFLELNDFPNGVFCCPECHTQLAECFKPYVEEINE